MRTLLKATFALLLLVSTSKAQTAWTPELQIKVRAVATPRVSPDGRRVVYTVSEPVTTAGLAVDAVFTLRISPYLRALAGATAVTITGYAALLAQTWVSFTPVDLGEKTIAQMRSAFTAGARLLMPPVDFTF